MTNGIMKIKESYLKEAEQDAEEKCRENYNFLKQKINGYVTSSSVGIEKYRDILTKEIKTILAIERSLIDIDFENGIKPGDSDSAKDVLSKYDRVLKESEDKPVPDENNGDRVKLKYAMLGGFGSAYGMLQEEIENIKDIEKLKQCENSLNKINITLPEGVASLLKKDKVYIDKILEYLKDHEILKTRVDMDIGILYAKYVVTKTRYELQRDELKKLDLGDKYVKNLRKMTLQLDGITITDMEVENTMTKRKVGDQKSSEITSEIDEVKWDDVIGQEEAKKTLRDSAVRFLGTYDAGTKLSIFETIIGTKPPKAILLYGPPGIGKTFVLKAAITEAEQLRQDLTKNNKFPAKNMKIHFNIITPDQIKDKYIGESAKAIKSVFDQAKKEAPSLLVIDELDAFFSRRSDRGFNEGEREIVSILMQELDGIKKSNGYILIGITNMPKMVDKAILSRFDKKIEFFNPKNAEEVASLFKVYLKNLIENKAIPKLTESDWGTIGKTGYGVNFTGRLVKQFVMSLEQERNDILTELYKDNKKIIEEYHKNPDKIKKELNEKSRKFTVEYICQKMAEFSSHAKHSETYTLE